MSSLSLTGRSLCHIALLCVVLSVVPGCFISYGVQGGVRVDTQGDVSLVTSATWESGSGGNRDETINGARVERVPLFFTGLPMVRLGAGFGLRTRRPRILYDVGMSAVHLNMLNPGSRTLSMGLGLQGMVLWDAQWRSHFGYGPGVTLGVGELTRRLEVNPERSDYGFATRSLYVKSSVLFFGEDLIEGESDVASSPVVLGFELGGSLKRVFADEIYLTEEEPSEQEMCISDECEQ